MVKKYLFIIITSFMLISDSKTQTLPTVAYVDLQKYAGKWYEIASIPQSFQRGCHCTTAEYSLSEKGYVIVENRCNRGSVRGKESYIKGKAFVVANSGNAKLLVQFFWPFKGKYWIIDLADDYSYAVVGHPNRAYLWILARKPSMDIQVYHALLGKLKAQGFDTSKIKITQHIE
jgi:apolipoprotein D and lipocalin family protein